MFSHLMQSLHSLHRSASGADRGPAARRVEVCPPALVRTTASQPIGLRAWLGSSWLDSTSATPRRAQRPPEQRRAPLAAVRAEFRAAVGDVYSNRALAAAEAIDKARSLRELWHLRADVYTLVATQHDEAEAQRRLARLNRHFTTRSARAGLAWLDLLRAAPH